MDRLIYTAVSGMNASMVRERVIASNMANAHTVGFRAEVIRATPTTLQGPQLQVRAMTNTDVNGAIMKEGAATDTGRPLDVALQGRALLAVQASDGTEAYTRRGDLSVSASGVLENGDGLPVIGDQGPISVPPGSMVSIAPDGGVLLSDPENPGEAPQRLDRLKLVSSVGSKIDKGLDGQFRVNGGGVLPADADARLVPGALEQSNVNPSEVLVEMISAQRLFELRTKMIDTARDLDESGARLMRLQS